VKTFDLTPKNVAAEQRAQPSSEHASPHPLGIGSGALELEVRALVYARG
jgi:hypothetical protein